MIFVWYIFYIIRVTRVWQMTFWNRIMSHSVISIVISANKMVKTTMEYFSIYLGQKESWSEYLFWIKIWYTLFDYSLTIVYIKCTLYDVIVLFHSFFKVCSSFFESLASMSSQILDFPHQTLKTPSRKNKASIDEWQYNIRLAAGEKWIKR